MSKPHRTARSTWARHSRRTSSMSAWSQRSETVRGKPAVSVQQRGGLGDRSPAVEVVLGVEGEPDPDVIAPEPRRRLARPGCGDDERGAGADPVAERVVDADGRRVAEAEIGAVEDQQLGVGPVSEALGNGRHAPDRSARRRSGGAARPGRDRPPRRRPTARTGVASEPSPGGGDALEPDRAGVLVDAPVGAEVGRRRTGRRRPGWSPKGELGL